MQLALVLFYPGNTTESGPRRRIVVNCDEPTHAVSADRREWLTLSHDEKLKGQSTAILRDDQRTASDEKSLTDFANGVSLRLPLCGAVMRDTNSTAIPRTPPVCVFCVEAGKTTSVKLSFTHDGVEYWRCEACGRVWSQRHGRPHKRARPTQTNPRQMSRTE